ncbi:biotin carboxylase N-terminal domain-containing protein [Nocardiopsis rhodophaea]
MGTAHVITSLLVANRGEIARRVLRTCRTLGIGTVAVYSDADADAPHTREADAAVRLPGRAPADTYLNGAAIVAAAERAGADAVHPGYGFLSENAGFAREVRAAGLTWVGPPPEAIDDMGSKIRAKEIARRAGVPAAAVLEPEEVTAADLPVLIKASAGGGGRGMRIVRALDALPAEAGAARAEAAAAFGDAAVFCERYLERGRHIEVQLLADTHGTVWAVGERDCSLQRRHQKVVEESPAPGIPDELRERLHEAARRMAGAIGYTGAGTAEFLVDTDGTPAFLEMNTRLQVEHPVTECVTGLDLVEWQLRIAEGEALAPEGPPSPSGHAIEARLYAEDPAHDWRPSGGTVAAFEVPGTAAEFGVLSAHGIRVDSGVAPGSTVGADYDALLAKVIAWGAHRGDAARRLAAALARARLHGVGTNRDLLVRVLRDTAFRAGDVHTGFLTGAGADGRGPGALARPLADPAAERLAALAAAVADAVANRRAAPALGGLPAGWRNLPAQPQVKRYRGDTGAELAIAYRCTRDGRFHPADLDGVRVERAEPDEVVLEIDGVRRTFGVTAYGPDRMTCVDSPLGAVTLRPLSRFPESGVDIAPGTLLAPMPGTVGRIAVAVGQPVRADQPLLWLEAMKMEHRITAPAAGVVTELPVAPGQRVDAGAALAVVHEDDANSQDSD